MELCDIGPPLINIDELSKKKKANRVQLSNTLHSKTPSPEKHVECSSRTCTKRGTEGACEKLRQKSKYPRKKKLADLKVYVNLKGFKDSQMDDRYLLETA